MLFRSLASAAIEPGCLASAEFRRRGQQSENLLQLLLQPVMQNCIGTGGHTFDTNLPCGGMEQREQFSRPVLGVFMGLFDWLPFWLPVMPRIGDCLGRSSFILRPDGESFLLS